MSTIKSSAENLTLNADGSGNDVLVQSNGSTKAIVTGEGNVGIGVTPETWNSARPGLQIGSTGSISGKNDVSDNHMNVSANAFLNRTSLASGWDYMYTNKATNYYQQDGNHVFRTAPSGSADAAITWTTGLEVLNAGQARAKNGLLFGTDTAAANTLNDYETGTWTPARLSNYGGFPSSIGGSVSGTYVKVGKVVTCYFSIDMAGGAAVSLSDAGIFTGIPFSPSFGGVYVGVGSAIIYGGIGPRANAHLSVVVKGSDNYLYTTVIYEETGGATYGKLEGQFTYETS